MCNFISENYKNKIIFSINEKFKPMGCDEETIQNLIDVSLESVCEEVGIIYKILQTDDISNLGFHTHTLKGVLLNVGLEKDGLKFKEIKHLFEEGKTDEEIKNITKERLKVLAE